MKQNYPIIIVLVLSLLVGILTFTHYGESWDDLSLQNYANRSLKAYHTWRQQSTVQIAEEDLGNYGPSYVMTVMLGTRALTALTPLSPPDARHLLYFITYLMGVWAFYALGTRWLTRNTALGTTLLFMTQPVFWGHAFINPKDTPFLSFFLISVFFGLKMVDSAQPLSVESLSLPTKKILALFTVLWLGTIFSLFIITDAFHTVLTSLVTAAQQGQTNIVSLVASDIHKVAPEIYIQRYFTFFLRAREIYSLLFTLYLLYLYYRRLPSIFRLLSSVLLPAFFLGFTTSLRILGPFAGVVVTYYALRTKGKQAVPLITFYTVIAIIITYLTWPYLWMNPVGHFLGSLKAMSAYPWHGQVLYNGTTYASTNLPPSYLPVLFGLQLTEPVWALAIAGTVTTLVGMREKRTLIELTVLWFIIPFFGFISLHSALYDNFRQVIFILPPVFWMAGVILEKIKNTKWQTVLVTLCLLPAVVGIIRLYPYEYIYYNSFIGGVDGAQGRFELDYWGTSYREAALYVNKIAPPNATIWVVGPSHLVELYTREDLKVYSTGESERVDHYNYVITTTRANLDQTSYPDAEIVHKIQRGNAVLTVIKRP
jgi:hypothetical protein